MQSHMDEKRPPRGRGAPKGRVRHTSTRRRLFAQVDFRREMRPIAFVDPEVFSQYQSGETSNKSTSGQLQEGGPADRRWPGITYHMAISRLLFSGSRRGQVPG